LGLAARGWSVEECIHKFETVCKRAFQPRRLAYQPFVGFIVQNYYHSLYRTTPFEQVLREAFSEEDLFGAKPADPSTPPLKVAVTTAAASLSVVLSNYNRLPENSRQSTLQQE